MTMQNTQARNQDLYNAIPDTQLARIQGGGEKCEEPKTVLKPCPYGEACKEASRSADNENTAPIGMLIVF